MSYVDFFADDRWTERDHIARTEAMVRQHFSADEEMILSRKVLGAQMGQYELTEQDEADLELFAQVTQAARAAGIEARADAALLHAALDHEAAQRELASLPPAPEPPEEGEPEEDPYAERRQLLLDLLDSATEDVLNVVALRAAARAEDEPLPPEPEPEPEPEPQP